MLLEGEHVKIFLSFALAKLDFTSRSYQRFRSPSSRIAALSEDHSRCSAQSNGVAILQIESERAEVARTGSAKPQVLYDTKGLASSDSTDLLKTIRYEFYYA